ncbi:rRNA processing protein gar2 [Penicillium brasilianum]|uniref:rRNA processing protein gar2 n=1 Tax=Penicillium brasilianum TaxID=104259 RepID=A0A1S9RC90_PENBI|nr:rRNA processing protein gar2 [Penicillium brasilianum]
MAPDKKGSKRKAAPVASDSPAKKTKKVEAKAAKVAEDATPKSILKKKENGTAKAKETKSASTAKANGPAAREVKPRKRAADFLSDEETEKPAPATAKKPVSKKTKKDETVSAQPAKKSAAAKVAKPTPKPKKVEEVPEESDDEDFQIDASVSEDSEEEIDDAEDDQTAALIKGFESSGDEDESGDEGYNSKMPIPKIPDTSKAEKKMKKLQKGDSKDEPGTVYVGRIPHGFYEHQMRAYFSQFGEITKLRLSRNRLTGRSKHYAFIEFASTTVAKIVAETMDNYLMYSHILKCKFVPAEQLHPEVWKGANRRFKRTPWNQIERKRLLKGKTREEWSKRIEQEQRKRLAKADKLKALGYQIDLPQLKAVEDVPIQVPEVEEPKAVEAAATEEAVEEPVKVIEAAATTDDTPKKTTKKGKKTEEAPKQEVAAESPAAKSPATKTKKTAKKTGKSKAKA